MTAPDTPFPDRYPPGPGNTESTRAPVPLCIGTGRGNAPHGDTRPAQGDTPGEHPPKRPFVRPSGLVLAGPLDVADLLGRCADA